MVFFPARLVRGEGKHAPLLGKAFGVSFLTCAEMLEKFVRLLQHLAAASEGLVQSVHLLSGEGEGCFYFFLEGVVLRCVSIEYLRTQCGHTALTVPREYGCGSLRHGGKREASHENHEETA